MAHTVVLLLAWASALSRVEALRLPWLRAARPRANITVISGRWQRVLVLFIPRCWLCLLRGMVPELERCLKRN